MTNDELWQAALGEIELSISKANFITWFKNTAIASVKDGHVVVGVPNGFAKEWLENKYNLYILRALRNIQSDIKSVSCSITTGQNTFFKRPTLDAVIPNQPLPVQNPGFNEKRALLSQENNLNPKYTFENAPLPILLLKYIS